jgi:GTPase SAR1 family protein
MFNLDKIGRPIARIDGGKNDKKIISLSDADESNGFKNIRLKEGKFSHIPNTDQERDILYITGPSGSGKSWYANTYIKNYKKTYPKNNIYMFSPVIEDESISSDIKRVKLDDRMITDPLKIGELAESLVIFDDIDVIKDKKLREAVYALLNEVLEVGRHIKVSCIITNHLPTNGKETRRMLNEAHSITYFPAAGSKVQLNRLLEQYIGMDKKDIKKAKHSGSRWVTVFKNYPQFVMTENEMYLLSTDDD